MEHIAIVDGKPCRGFVNIYIERIDISTAYDMSNGYKRYISGAKSFRGQIVIGHKLDPLAAHTYEGLFYYGEDYTKGKGTFYTDSLPHKRGEDYLYDILGTGEPDLDTDILGPEPEPNMP